MWRAPPIRPASHSWSSRTSISCASWSRRRVSASSGVTSRSPAMRTRYPSPRTGVSPTAAFRACGHHGSRFDVAAAGAGGRSLLAWPAHDGSTRRIELLTLDPSGTVSEPRWLTGTERGATSPAVAMAADGTGLVAWVDGMPNGIVTAAAVTPDGAAGPAQPLDTEPGGSPRVAVGPGGAAVAAWPSGGELRAALRRPGAERFSLAV